jgi:putative peptidoglycan lipid II flippase
LPIVFGLASGQIIALNLPRFLAGGLAEGDLTAIDNANRLMQLPLAVFASGPAIALYPTLSLLAAQGAHEELRAQLASALRRTLLLTMLATALLIALREPVVRLLLEHGRFRRADTLATTQVLLWYSFGIVGLSAQQMLARGFYARGDTTPPIYMGLATMAAFLVLGFIFMSAGWGAVGLAAAASLVLTALGVWMGIALRIRLGGWDDGATMKVLCKGALAAVAAYALAHFAAHYGMQLTAGFETETASSLLKLAGRSGVLVAGTVAGVGTFVLMTRVLRLPLRGAPATSAVASTRKATDKSRRPQDEETSRLFVEYQTPQQMAAKQRDPKSSSQQPPSGALDESGGLG